MNQAMNFWGGLFHWQALANSWAAVLLNWLANLAYEANSEFALIDWTACAWIAKQMYLFACSGSWFALLCLDCSALDCLCLHLLPPGSLFTLLLQGSDYDWHIVRSVACRMCSKKMISIEVICGAIGSLLFAIDDASQFLDSLMCKAAKELCKAATRHVAWSASFEGGKPTTRQSNTCWLGLHGLM